MLSDLIQSAAYYNTSLRGSKARNKSTQQGSKGRLVELTQQEVEDERERLRAKEKEMSEAMKAMAAAMQAKDEAMQAKDRETAEAMKAMAQEIAALRSSQGQPAAKSADNEPTGPPAPAIANTIYGR